MGKLKSEDESMHRAYLLGIYPGLTADMLRYEIEVIGEFVKAKPAKS
jgi:hypothetical protein